VAVKYSFLDEQFSPEHAMDLLVRILEELLHNDNDSKHKTLHSVYLRQIKSGMRR
jgi:20S proteasome alpha/beta subunit